MINENGKNEIKWEKFDKKINLGEVTGKRKDDIIKIIKSYEEIFEYDEEKLGKVNTVKHKIEIREERQQEAFEELKIRLMEKPVLDYPNFEKEFILITDASGERLGAVLSQKNEENKEFVIAYASRSLVGAEKNYAITELECLAIFWGIKYFHKFLAGRKFTVITDHSALKGLMNAKVPTGRRARWDDVKYFTNKEAILLNLEEKTEKELLRKLGRKNKPQVVIVDGPDGTGKSTVVENMIKRLEEKDDLKIIFNKFKRRRNDDSRFKEPSKEYEWLFRKQVVEEINRRITL
ncbi:enzymatic polyprotein, putative [Rhizophagus irregularis DAOM 181602=DAOM 197198]|nr:enzymatic polyprotein, putative [Rhizophagus irregularis DAOM 181602=DAOM 197198]